MAQSSAANVARVLVVDDEDGVREFVNRTLQIVGHRTTVAASGPSALAIAESETPFDLLVTDLRMPGMNGDELARRIRQRHPEVRVLYLTGYSEQLFKEKGALWEGEAFVDKPVSANALLQAVSLLLYGEFTENVFSKRGGTS